MMTSGVQSSTSIYSIKQDVDPFTSRQNNSLDFYFSNMLINEHLTYSNHELVFMGQLY